MSFRSFIQDLKGGIGSLSRRSFDVKLLPSYNGSHNNNSSSSNRSRVVSETRVLKEDVASLRQQSPWANMPPEILRDVIQRLESSESCWPSRKHVVACAAVCRSWRKVTMELVKSPEHCGKLTFPRSLKQCGPREGPVQCYIKRDRPTSTYRLYLGLSPTLMENGKFLLAAKKIRRPTSTDYIISLDAEDQSRGSNSYVGKLRSNFLGTKFTIYDSQAPHSGAVASTSRAGRRVGSKQVSPKIPAGSYTIANIVYELNVLGTRGPRRMQCTMHTIPASRMQQQPSQQPQQQQQQQQSQDSANRKSSSSSSEEDVRLAVPVAPKGPNPAPGGAGASDASKAAASSSASSASLVLKNKQPRWHDQLQCWCLNFKGRVTVASVKNFQLVAAEQPPGPDADKVVLQFGKIGKDMFTMDYRYPLSAFQAFAICLSSFDTKLACE